MGLAPPGRGGGGGAGGARPSPTTATATPSDHELALRGQLRLLGPPRGPAGSCDRVLDAALVVAPADAEVAVLGPVWVPGVRDLPVLHTVLDAPAHELHCMAAGHLARDVVVDAADVVLEVAVDGEGRLHGAPGHDHLLDLLLHLHHKTMYLNYDL